MATHVMQFLDRLKPAIPPGAAIGVGGVVANWWDWTIEAAYGVLPEQWSHWFANNIATLPSWVPATIAGLVTLSGGLYLQKRHFANKLKPNIEIQFDPNDKECVHPTQFSNGIKLQMFRVRVWHTGVGGIYHSGFVTNVTKGGADAGFTGNVAITFAPAEDERGALRKILYGGIAQFLDVGWVVEPGSFFLGTEFSWKLGN